MFFCFILVYMYICNNFIINDTTPNKKIYATENVCWEKYEANKKKVRRVHMQHVSINICIIIM